MTIARALKWLAGALLLPVVLAALFIAIYGWNWLRQPIEQMTLDKTGRQLVIGGDIEVDFGWPLPRIRTGAVSFANPAWASEKQMVTSEALEIVIDLPQLLRQNIVLPEVALRRPVVFLEQGADGRKNWLLDREQLDESARLRIGRLTLDQGSVGYDDVRQKTSNVETQKGMVQLTGFVSSEAAMDQAVKVARGIKGVTSVKNDMHIKK